MVGHLGTKIQVEIMEFGQSKHLLETQVCGLGIPISHRLFLVLRIQHMVMKAQQPMQRIAGLQLQVTQHLVHTLAMEVLTAHLYIWVLGQDGL